MQQAIIKENIFIICEDINTFAPWVYPNMQYILEEWILLTWFEMEARQMDFRHTFISVGYVRDMYITKDKFHQC